MELLAAGFNAWAQLYPEGPSHNDVAHEDLRTFTRVLHGSTIDQVQAFLSHTIVRSDAASKGAGHCPRDHAQLYESDRRTYSTLAETATGAIAIIDHAGTIRQFDSLSECVSAATGRAFQSLPHCTQVVAYDTGFAALSADGSVYTWGDERYAACLGRDVSGASPADKPGLVVALQGLPTGRIAKLAAGGYMLAAVTTGNDLYLWGGHPVRKTVPTEVTDEPTPIVVEEEDIVDVAIGQSHLLVLTTQGRVYVIGENRNGQLGLASIATVDTWTPIDLNLQQGSRAVALAAGPRASFIMIKTS